MTYRLTYEVKHHDPAIEVDELAPGHGGADALLIAGISFAERGTSHVLMTGFDGRSRSPLAIDEWFKVWLLIGAHLAEAADLGTGKRQFARVVVRAFAKWLDRAQHRTTTQQPAVTVTETKEE